jgi:hypothetical protein
MPLKKERVTETKEMGKWEPRDRKDVVTSTQDHR